MKKKEKDHLKADPFVHFFETTFTFFKHNRRSIVMAAGALALVVLILLAALLFRNLSSTGENKLYNQAFRIQADPKHDRGPEDRQAQGNEVQERDLGQRPAVPRRPLL